MGLKRAPSSQELGLARPGLGRLAFSLPCSWGLASTSFAKTLVLCEGCKPCSRPPSFPLFGPWPEMGMFGRLYTG
eukprot:9127065-Alexandrium_andersonii.AAC.1